MIDLWWLGQFSSDAIHSPKDYMLVVNLRSIMSLQLPHIMVTIRFRMLTPKNICGQFRVTSHTSQRSWLCNYEDPWLSSKGRTNSLLYMVGRNLRHAYILVMNLTQNFDKPWNIFHSLPCGFIHVGSSCIIISLDPHASPSSVKWTWMISTFSTNERS